LRDLPPAHFVELESLLRQLPRRSRVRRLLPHLWSRATPGLTGRSRESDSAERQGGVFAPWPPWPITLRIDSLGLSDSLRLSDPKTSSGYAPGPAASTVRSSSGPGRSGLLCFSRPSSVCVRSARQEQPGPPFVFILPDPETLSPRSSLRVRRHHIAKQLRSRMPGAALLLNASHFP
jgi:hypothetical protein